MPFHDESGSTTVRISPAADLNTWSQREWTAGVQINELPPLEHLVIRTCNSTYEITVLDPRAGEVMVCGGRFFPTPARASLAGASLGGSFLKLRGVYVGFSIELWCDGDRIVTSPVRSVDRVESDRVQ